MMACTSGFLQGAAVNLLMPSARYSNERSHCSLHCHLSSHLMSNPSRNNLQRADSLVHLWRLSEIASPYSQQNSRRLKVRAVTSAPPGAPSSDTPDAKPMRPSLAKAMRSISRQKQKYQQAELDQMQRQQLVRTKEKAKIRDDRLAEGLGDWKRGWPGGEKGLKDWVDALELNSEANWEIMKE